MSIKNYIKLKIRNATGYNELISAINTVNDNCYLFPKIEIVKSEGGGDSKDIPLLEKYLAKEILHGKEGYITDFQGIRHSTEVFPETYQIHSGVVFQKLPIPDDGFHAETIEYIACFDSVEHADSSYTMFELGAGWGPWMSIAGTAAKKKGIGVIDLIGVEGAHNKMAFIKSHLTENGLRPPTDEPETYHNGIHINLYDGVVNTTGEDLEFPEIPQHVYDASLVKGTNLRTAAKMVKVKGYSFADISGGYDCIDFVHMDLQGYEDEFIRNSVEIFKKKVKYLFIGTHSRMIESNLLNILYGNGFKLIREQPCHVEWPESEPQSFINITTKDGGQFWVNKNLTA
jgi:hypothetical protein